jgi:electron transfer flavoprotein alpha subunit
MSLTGDLIGFAKSTGKVSNLIVFNEEEAMAKSHLGADKIFVLRANTAIIESCGKAVANFLREQSADLFVVSATTRGRELAASVAGYLDCGMVSDVSSLSYTDGKIVTERLIYGGALVQKEVLNGLSVVTVPAGVFEPVEGGTDSEIIIVSLEADTRVKLVETAPIVKEGADLSSAEKVVCVGLGMEKEDDMQMVRDLAEVLGAEIGCSRAIAEEKHWLPAEQYIGISGAKVSPQLYIGIGVSGQVQHVIGVRDSKIIVAVNNNEKAPIFKACDYGIVGDMYEVIPLLTEALSTAKIN